MLNRILLDDIITQSVLNFFCLTLRLRIPWVISQSNPKPMDCAPWRHLQLSLTLPWEMLTFLTVKTQCKSSWIASSTSGLLLSARDQRFNVETVERVALLMHDSNCSMLNALVLSGCLSVIPVKEGLIASQVKVLQVILYASMMISSAVYFLCSCAQFGLWWEQVDTYYQWAIVLDITHDIVRI